MNEELQNERNSMSISKVDDEKTNRLEVLPQVLAVVVKNILTLHIGMTIGFITILIPRIIGNDPNEPFSLTEEQLSWISSAVFISACMGSFGSGFIAQPFGRKRVMISMTVPFFCVWLVHYFANQVWQIFFALCLSGICGGLIAASVYSYVAEISQPHLRGMLSATNSLTVIFGMFVEILIGTFLPWRTAALVSSALPLTAFCLLWFLPESPHWLLSKHREEEARKSLAWYRGWTSADSVEKEFQELIENYQKKQNAPKSVVNMQTIKNKCQLFLKKTFIFPFCLVSFLYFLSNFTGAFTLQTYSVLIFATLEVPINKYYATILMGSCELIGSLLSIVFVRYLGKRKMGILSLFGVIICNVLVGVYAFINGIKELQLKVDFENISLDNINGRQWIPLFLLLSISFMGHCGLKSLPWILVGEVFSFDTRSFGCGFGSAMFDISAFSSNKIFLKMINHLTFPGVYWFYGGVGCIGIVVIYLAMPETEGKTLQEISDHFAGSIKLDNNVRKKGKIHPAVVARNNTVE